jgi:hypothetical protein
MKCPDTGKLLYDLVLARTLGNNCGNILLNLEMHEETRKLHGYVGNPKVQNILRHH